MESSKKECLQRLIAGESMKIMNKFRTTQQMRLNKQLAMAEQLYVMVQLTVAEAASLTCFTLICSTMF